MPNAYYNFTTPYVPGTKVRSDQANNENNGIEAGFDLLPSTPSSLTRGVPTLGIEVQGANINTYNVTMPDTRSSNQVGDEIVFQATHTNDGVQTAVINVDGIGDVEARGSDLSALESGDIVNGEFYVWRFTGAVFQLMNPSRSYLENAVDASIAAAASAAAAAASETNAATSETNAAGSATSSEDWAIRAEDDPVPVSSGGDGATTFSAFHWAQKALAGAVTGFIDGTGTANPTSGGPYDYNAGLGFRNASAQQTARWGWNGTDTFISEVSARSALHFGQLTDSGGNSIVIHEFDPDGSDKVEFIPAGQDFRIGRDGGFPIDIQSRNPGVIDLVTSGGEYRIGGSVMVTNSGVNAELHGGTIGSAGAGLVAQGAGVASIQGDTANDSDDRYLSFSQSNGTRRGFIGNLSTSGTQLDVRNEVHGGDIALQVEDGGGVLREGVRVAGSGPVTISAAGVATLQATSAGISTILGDANVDGDDRLLQMSYANGTRRAVFGHQSADSGVLSVINEVHGAALELRAENAGGSAVTLLSGDPDGQTDLYGFGEITLSALGNGIAAVYGDSNTDGDTRELQFRYPDNTERGKVGHLQGLSGVFSLRNQINGESVRVEATNAGSTVVPILEGDPDSSFRLYRNNLVGFASEAPGSVQLRAVDNNDSSDRDLLFTHQDQTVRAEITNDSGSNFVFSNLVNSGNVVLRSNNSGGTPTNILTGDPDGSVNLFHAGNSILASNAAGVMDLLGDANTDVDDRLLRFTHANGTVRGLIGHDGGSDLTLENQVHGGDVVVSGENAGGTAATLAVFDPDGSAELYYDNVSRFSTRDSDKVRVSSEVNIDVSNGLGIEFARLNGTVVASLHREDEDFILASETNEGHLIFRARNTGGTDRVIMDADPDLRTIIRNPISNEDAIQTLNSSLGGASVNNQLTGGGFERVLTVSDLPGAAVNEFRQRTTNLTRSGPGIAVTNDPVLAVSGLAAGFYAVEGYLRVTDNNGGSDFRLDLRDASEATLNSGAIAVQHFNETTTFGTANSIVHEISTTTVLPVTLIATTGIEGIWFKGTAELSSSGTIALAWAQQTDVGGGTTLQAGSWLRVTGA